MKALVKSSIGYKTELFAIWFFFIYVKVLSKMLYEKYFFSKRKHSKDFKNTCVPSVFEVFTLVIKQSFEQYFLL